MVETELCCKNMPHVTIIKAQVINIFGILIIKVIKQTDKM